MNQQMTVQDFDKQLLSAAHLLGEARESRVSRYSEYDMRALISARSKRDVSPRRLIEMNARQYFASYIGQAMIAASSVTPGTTETSIFSTYTDCNLYLPVGYGLAAPLPGQIYEFALGGIITTPATGTLVIKPYMGQGASATSFTGAVALGASPAQTVTASLASIPWEISGHLVFRTISSAGTGSTCWITGSFRSQGTLATAGLGWTIPFGSTAAVSVDTTGTVANSYGCLTFTVTFSQTGGTIITEWCKMLTVN